MLKVNSTIHKITDKFNKDSFVFMFLRKIFSIILVPILFSYTSSHIYSVIKNRSQFKNNKHYPWLTYPAIEFLKSKNLKGKSVLEFGSGSSTIFFLNKECIIKTFESEKKWFDLLPSNKNIEKINLLVENYQQLENYIQKNEKFDLILIDGHERTVIMNYVIKNNLLNHNGVIIFDNSEGYDLNDLIKEEPYSNFQKIDFYGFSPGGSIDRHCTSFFFMEKSFVFNIKEDIHSKEEINKPL